MILLCCYESFYESPTNWEAVTAIGTAILAVFTVLLASAAIVQLKDIKKFNKNNENLTHKQSAENIIIKQIEFHYKILEKIETNKTEAFRKIYENFKGIYGFEKAPTMEEKIQASYAKLYEEYGYLLGHYYRNLYRIFKNINEIIIIDFDKKYYAKLVRAQLSEYEIILLFYNCIWVKDDNKFKKLVEEYELLEGINYDKLLNRKHDELYSLKAFGQDLI